MDTIRFLLRDNDAKVDVAILVIRIGIGFMFILHGYPKLFGGIEKWTSLGELGPGSLGIHFWYPVWGFIAAVSETIGGLFLILGIYVRLSSLMLFLTMLFAAGFHIASGKGSPYHAIESAIVFIGLFLTGSGKYNIYRFLKK